MSTRKIKKDVLAILQEPSLTTIWSKLKEYNQNDLVSPLFSAICRMEPLLRWHAITIFGKVVSTIYESNPESARIVMRRFLWSLNDESGGIGWGAPESMAEIMYLSRPLYREYGHMLISYMREDGPELFQDGNYLELPELQVGLLWGIGRLAINYQSDLLKEGVTEDVLKYLGSANGDVRGMAAWCLGNLSDKASLRGLVTLREDQHSLLLYTDGMFQTLTVSEVSKQACSKIDI